MKFRIHRLEHKAHSFLQHIPDDIHQKAWKKADEYAKGKYGENYKELKKTDYYVIIYDETSYKNELIKEIVIEYAEYVRTSGNGTPIYAMNYRENLDISNSNHLNFSETFTKAI